MNPDQDPIFNGVSGYGFRVEIGNQIRIQNCYALLLKPAWRFLLELDPASGSTKKELGIGAYLLPET